MHKNKPASRQIPCLLLSAGILLALAWLITALLPEAREMMLDMIVATLLAIVVTALLWRAGSLVAEAKPFWRLFAAAWATGLLGNIAWGIYEMITGNSISILSFVDGIYTIRYILILLALQRYPEQATHRRWTGLLAVLPTTTAMIWVFLYRHTLMAAPITLLRVRDFIGVAMYPVMDITLLYAAVLTWTQAAKSSLRNSLSILILALISYHVANWFQFSNLAIAGFTSGMPDVFWLLTDVLTGLAVYVFWQAAYKKPPTPIRAQWHTIVPYLASLLTIGVTLVDWILRRRVDVVLAACCLSAIGAVAGQYWLGRNDPQ